MAKYLPPSLYPRPEYQIDRVPCQVNKREMRDDSQTNDGDNARATTLVSAFEKIRPWSKAKHLQAAEDEGSKDQHLLGC